MYRGDRMNMNQVEAALAEIFNAPLKDWEKSKVVFWVDTNNEFIDEIEKLSVEDVKIMNIADELSHECGVLSHQLRRKEPPFADQRTTIKRITSCIIKLHAKQHDFIIQEVYLWLIVARFWNYTLKELVKEPLVQAPGIQETQSLMSFVAPRNLVLKA